MLSERYGLHRHLIYGDHVQPGLTLDELLTYIEHHRRTSAPPVDGDGSGSSAS